MNNPLAVASAAATFAEEWRELLLMLPDEYSCHMNCAEAEAAAALFTSLGRPDDAEAIIAGHAAHDEPGDAHYQEKRPSD